MKFLTTFFFSILLTILSYAQEPMLIGKVQLSALKKKPYTIWYNKGYSTYTPNKEIIAQLKHKIDSITITVFMGTWCSDSKEQLPRFYKITKQCNYATSKVTLIGASRSKSTPEHWEQDQNIIKLPTFIFYKHNKEIGRIIETPNTTIEEDMLNILHKIQQ